MADGNGTEWRARVERQIEDLQKDTKILLQAQVLHRGELSDHDKAIKGLEKLMAESIARQAGFDERVDKLVSAIDEWVRRSA